MEMQILELEIPKDFQKITGESTEDLKRRFKVAMAVDLFKQGKVSLGKAARLSGLPRHDFEEELFHRKIPLSLLTYEDVMDDLKKLQTR